MHRTAHRPAHHNALCTAHRLFQRYFLTFCSSSLSVSGLNPFSTRSSSGNTDGGNAVHWSLRRHSCHNRSVHYHLQHGGDNPATAWATSTNQVLPSFTTMVGDIDDSGRYSARRRWHHRPPARKRSVRRFGGEIIHLVIKQNTALARDMPVPKVVFSV